MCSLCTPRRWRKTKMRHLARAPLQSCTDNATSDADTVSHDRSFSSRETTNTSSLNHKPLSWHGRGMFQILAGSQHRLEALVFDLRHIDGIQAANNVEVPMLD